VLRSVTAVPARLGRVCSGLSRFGSAVWVRSVEISYGQVRFGAVSRLRRGEERFVGVRHVGLRRSGCVRTGCVVFWYVKARTGGLGWVRPVEISSVTVWRVKAVKTGQLSAGRGEVRLVKAVME